MNQEPMFFENEGTKTFYCESGEEFREILKQEGASREYIERIVTHEEAHAQAAKDLGYVVKGFLFSLGKKDLGDKIEYEVNASPVIPEGIENIPTEHAIKILLAPKDPSKYDLESARELGWRPKNG